MILDHVDQVVAAGARQSKACEIVGIDPRTLQRWRERGVGDDRRAGPRTAPQSKLSAREKRKVLDLVNSPEHRDLSGLYSVGFADGKATMRHRGLRALGRE